MSSPARKEPDDMAELEEIVGRFADEFALARAYKDVVRDAITPREAEGLLDGVFYAGVMSKIERIAARAATTKEAEDA